MSVYLGERRLSAEEAYKYVGCWCETGDGDLRVLVGISEGNTTEYGTAYDPVCFYPDTGDTERPDRVTIRTDLMRLFTINDGELVPKFRSRFSRDAKIFYRPAIDTEYRWLVQRITFPQEHFFEVKQFITEEEARQYAQGWVDKRIP